MATKLQPNSGIGATIHIVGLGFCVASYAQLSNITNPLHNGVGGSHQFLTIIGLTLTTITFVVGLFWDILPNKYLFALKHGLSVIATPLEVLIGTLYWSLHTIDQRLVVPPGHALPLIQNLGLHAAPGVMLSLDMLAGNPWSIRAFEALMLDSVFFLSYWAWLEYCFFFNGWYVPTKILLGALSDTSARFPYPLLMHLNLWQKLLHTVGAAGLMMSYTMVFKSLHEKIIQRSRKKVDW